MKVYTLKDLLTQVLITEDIISEIECAKQLNPLKSVGEIILGYSEKIGTSNFAVLSPGYCVSSLYFIFVLLDEDLKKTEAFSEIHVAGKSFCKKFFTRMRNALAHGRITVDEQYNFKFTDINMKNRADVFEYCCSINEVLELKNGLLNYYVEHISTTYDEFD